MNNLLSFESFSQRVKKEAQSKLSEERTLAQKATAATFETLLKKFDVASPSELSEDKREAFISELFGNIVTESINEKKEIAGKNAGNLIKGASAGRKIVIDNNTYLSLGNGKWKNENSGEKLNWIELSAIASALGDKQIIFEGGVNEVNYTSVSGTPKSDAEKKVAKFLNAMAKEYDYPVEDAIRATVAAIKKLGYEKLVGIS